MRFYHHIVIAGLAAAAASVTPAGAQTPAPDAYGPPQEALVQSGNQQADADARKELDKATAALHAKSRREAEDRLERAETALLNRQSLDAPGASSGQSASQTQAIATIENARAALKSHDIAQASQLADAAKQDIDQDAAQQPH